MKKAVWICLFLLALAATPLQAYACDFCSIYTQLAARELRGGSLNLGTTVNLLGYSKTRLDGESYQPGANQNHKISVVELEGAYDLTNRLSLQVDVPFVFQHYKRLVDQDFTTGSDEGLGDVALYGVLSAVQTKSFNGSFILQFVSGAKLPTGSTSKLSEVPDEHLRNSGIYGADLTMGTGSVDVPFAVLTKGDYRNNTVGGEVQYNLRTEGDYGYQYANDFRWDAWLGHNFKLEGETTFEPRIHLNGLVKGHDTRDGEEVFNSGLSFMNIGPQILFHVSNRLSFSVEVDAPLLSDNNGLQSMIDHRVLVEAKGRI